MKKCGLLRDERDQLAAQRRTVDRFDGAPVQQDAAFLRGIQPHQQPRERRFSGAAAAHDGRRAARGNDEVHAPENRPPGVVSEVEILQANGHGRRRSSGTWRFIGRRVCRPCGQRLGEQVEQRAQVAECSREVSRRGPHRFDRPNHLQGVDRGQHESPEAHRVPLHRLHADEQAGGHRGGEGGRRRQADREVQAIQLPPLALKAFARREQAATHLVFGGEVAQCLQVGESISQMRVGLEAGRRDGVRAGGQPLRAGREDGQVDERGDGERGHQGGLAQVDENPGHRQELDQDRKQAPGQVAGGQLGARASEIEAVLELAASTSCQVAHRQAQHVIEETLRQPAVEALVDRPGQERPDIRQRAAGEQQEQIAEGITEQGPGLLG